MQQLKAAGFKLEANIGQQRIYLDPLGNNLHRQPDHGASMYILSIGR